MVVAAAAAAAAARGARGAREERKAGGSGAHPTSRSQLPPPAGCNSDGRLSAQASSAATGTHPPHSPAPPPPAAAPPKFSSMLRSSNYRKQRGSVQGTVGCRANGREEWLGWLPTGIIERTSVIVTAAAPSRDSLRARHVNPLMVDLLPKAQR